MAFWKTCMCILVGYSLGRQEYLVFLLTVVIFALMALYDEWWNEEN